MLLHADLNVSAALASLHEFRSLIARTPDLSHADYQRFAEHIQLVDRLLGLKFADTLAPSRLEADATIGELVERRERSRAVGDFAAADQLRYQLRDLGAVFEDTPNGPRWYRSL